MPAAPKVMTVRRMSLPIISRRMSKRSAITPPNSIRPRRGTEDSISRNPAVAGEPTWTAVQDSAMYQTWSPSREMVWPIR
jgi:hypothetical protein